MPRTAVLCLMLVSAPAVSAAQTFHVSTTGSDATGDGSAGSPWATITHAVDSVPDGAAVEVAPGTYVGRVNLRQQFAQGIVVRSTTPYQARLRNDDRVVTCYTCQGVTLEGFDIAHSGPGAAPLVVHIQDLIDGTDFVRRVVLRDNVIHDSFDNDLVKINNGAGEITVTGNLFYNQTGSDEHLDVNSVTDVLIEGNVFFNDFEGSGRTNGNDTSSFIVIKDSDGTGDGMLGSRRITVRRNVFLHWQGSTGSNFVLLGEDGQPFFESLEVLVENNLLLGDSPHTMRAPFGVKGGMDATFRHNTVVGDLPSLAFAFRLNTEGQNPANENVVFRGNAWSDPTGTMDDFSDTPFGETASFTLAGNLYWNDGDPIPTNGNDLVNFTDDATRITADPMLPALTGLVQPRWDPAMGLFADGSATVSEVFQNLAMSFAVPSAGSALVDAAEPAHAPADDLLGNPRPMDHPDVGAVELEALTGTIFADGFESGDVSAWGRVRP